MITIQCPDDEMANLTKWNKPIQCLEAIPGNQLNQPVSWLIKSYSKLFNVYLSAQYQYSMNRLMPIFNNSYSVFNVWKLNTSDLNYSVPIVPSYSIHYSAILLAINVSLSNYSSIQYQILIFRREAALSANISACQLQQAIIREMTKLMKPSLLSLTIQWLNKCINHIVNGNK